MVETKFEKAILGRDIWIRLKQQYSITEDWYIVIFPTSDMSINKIARDYIKSFARKKYINHFLLLSRNENEKLNCEEIDVNEVQLNENEIEELTLYYRLQQFHRNIVIVSLDEPYASDGIIGKKGITLEDFVKDAIFV